MSLLRLLTSGKTLIGLKRSEGRYRLPGGRVLPSFGSKKNPFRATVFPEKADEGPSAAEASSPEGGAESGISSVGNGDGLVPHKDKAPNTDPTSCASASSEAAETREAVQAAPVPARRGGALRALLLWSRVRKPKLQVGFKGRSLVQTELSLESVKGFGTI